jgi:hypothetical protein
VRVPKQAKRCAGGADRLPQRLEFLTDAEPEAEELDAKLVKDVKIETG